MVLFWGILCSRGIQLAARPVVFFLPAAISTNHVCPVKFAQYIRRLRTLFIVIFIRAALEPAYSNGCGSLPERFGLLCCVLCAVCVMTVATKRSMMPVLRRVCFSFRETSSSWSFLLRTLPLMGFRQKHQITFQQQRKANTQRMLPCSFKFTSKIHAARKFVVGKYDGDLFVLEVKVLRCVFALLPLTNKPTQWICILQ